MEFYRSRQSSGSSRSGHLTLSFKALWQSQGLGTERGRGLHSLHFPKLALIPSFTTMVMKERETDRRNTLCTAQLRLQWKIIFNKHQGFWKQNRKFASEMLKEIKAQVKTGAGHQLSLHTEGSGAQGGGWGSRLRPWRQAAVPRHLGLGAQW